MTTATEEELKLTEQPDGSAIIGEPPAADPPKDDTLEGGQEDTRLTEEQTGDEQGHAEETPEEAEARRERNRQRRAESKARRKEHIEGLHRELAARDAIINELNQRMSVVERKSTGSEMAQLEAAEREAFGYVEHFKKLHGQAVAQANGELAAEALEKLMLSNSRLEKIQGIKQAMTQARPQTPPLDPRLQANATAWMERNKWFDISGRDEDSRLTMALDQMVRDAGHIPETPQYWEALDEKIKKHLPHRANSAYNRPQRGSEHSPTPPQVPVVGSGREYAPAAGAGAYKLSPQRVQAMKEAGIWDDPKARADMIRRYQEIDKEQRA